MASKGLKLILNFFSNEIYRIFEIQKFKQHRFQQVLNIGEIEQKTPTMRCLDFYHHLWYNRIQDDLPS